MTPAGSRRALQVAVLLAICVPIGAGGAGVFLGARFTGGDAATLLQDSHFRYLSGLLLGIGIAFGLTIPDIERHASTFRLLTAIVFCGGLARLLGLFAAGTPPTPMMFGLAMELCVTPALCFWQNSVARRAKAPATEF
ncbi:MAG: hypothetical protein JWM36_4242 [Hyphomicrobiales bacterium]|nr:hypothetical protein [Hyphomicrobiales bacterium]